MTIDDVQIVEIEEPAFGCNKMLSWVFENLRIVATFFRLSPKEVATCDDAPSDNFGKDLSFKTLQ